MTFNVSIEARRATYGRIQKQRKANTASLVKRLYAKAAEFQVEDPEYAEMWRAMARETEANSD